MRRSGLISMAVVLIAALPIMGGPKTVGSPAQRNTMAAPSDFNGDGFADLAIGVPEEDLGDVGDAGAVNVLYGTATGLSSVGNQFWNQDSSGVQERAEANDLFGLSVTTGDFSGDGYADLAVGVPEEIDGGGVNMLYGSPDGLSSVGNQFWSQDSPGILEHAELHDDFGWSLAAGDFNGDWFADLAVGVPEEVAGGGVNVLYGTAEGLSATGNQFWNEDSPGIVERVELEDTFGMALASGDFDGDGIDDLAVGDTREDIGDIPQAGSVHVLYGSTGGLTAIGNQLWNQDSPGIADSEEDFDEFGAALVAGDFAGTGFDALAVGVRWEDLGDVNDAGAVNVLYGSPGGLTAIGNQLWSQDSPEILDDGEGADYFGFVLAAADFDADGFIDMAVGASNDGVGDAKWAGQVNVLYGSGQGLTANRNQLWSQGSPGILGRAEPHDSFGTSLLAVDFGMGSWADLAVGAPDEELGGRNYVGAVNAIYGSPAGLSSDGNQFWSQDAFGVADHGEAFDFFGFYRP